MHSYSGDAALAAASRGAISKIFRSGCSSKKYKNSIGNIEKLNDKFITEELGYEIYPLKQISDLNLYNIWAKNPDDEIKTYILKFLFHVYKNTKLKYNGS